MNLETSYRNFTYKLKGFIFKTYLQLHGCKVGKNLKCLGWPKIRCVPKGNIFIGDHVAFGRNVTLEITPSGKLIMDNHALLADNIILSSISCIHLKKWCAIAENTSIRDHFHNMKKNIPYRLQSSKSKPVTIGEDGGVGAGCAVLMGSNIPDGTFIGAGSLVLEKDKMEPYALYSGNPLKFIRYRE